MEDVFSHWLKALLMIQRCPTIKIRDLAIALNVTDRTASKIIHELKESGMVQVTRHGRRNRYRVDKDRCAQTWLSKEKTLAELLIFLSEHEPHGNRGAEHECWKA